MVNSMTDQALLQYVRERQKLIAIACSIVEDQAVAEDLVQDSWLRWQGSNYSGKDAIPIFKRIVSNLAKDFLRKKKVEQNALSDVYWQREGTPCSERIVSARQELRFVIEALRRLPPRSVKAFRLRFIDGLKYAEIAEILQISVSRAHALAEDVLIEVTP